ncbi:hypothetical protein VIMS_00506 [Mycobacterium marinum]|nr:hypothetical protein VIMS_00506 [Mycobacterium marinum]
MIGAVAVLSRPVRPPGPTRASANQHTITALAVIKGIAGGIYGIGGGFILGPILVGPGLPVTEVALTV